MTTLDFAAVPVNVADPMIPRVYRVLRTRWNTGDTFSLELVPQEGGDIPASRRFDRVMSDVRALLASDGEYSEQDKLGFEQITSILQKLSAGREKQQQDALSGKMGPAVARAAYAGAGG